NPQDHRKALNLIHDRLLSIYLVAFQSWIWNRILGHYLTTLGYTDPTILITGLDFPLPPALPEALLEMQLSMPNLTVRYPDAVLPSVEAVLGEEGMTLEDFKARILRRVYL
ncbi:MAG TPA: tRNA pseudouridine(13) synthase TruD, partial [Anaerolineae bacterium]|nr:tRNA pseudouridine(13) synthase TruD [Anaerolineae bacterium]